MFIYRKKQKNKKKTNRFLGIAKNSFVQFLHFCHATLHETVSRNTTQTYIMARHVTTLPAFSLSSASLIHRSLLISTPFAFNDVIAKVRSKKKSESTSTLKIGLRKSTLYTISESVHSRTLKCFAFTIIIVALQKQKPLKCWRNSAGRERAYIEFFSP